MRVRKKKKMKESRKNGATENDFLIGQWNRNNDFEK
jgi:hypothetical protein